MLDCNGTSFTRSNGICGPRPKTKNKEQDKSETSHLIQKKMLDSRSIIISGEINQALTEKVVSQLLLLQEIDDRPIKLYINS
ncbi:ATP-dependent Clp protease proteolytic subunit [Sodalis praecaptivus]|nr:ATP-dependent Clp protease proteolytic subunit [Sodalis praecaptivus]